MPLEAKRFRHVAVAIPVFTIAGLVTVGTGQQRAQPQQPDVAYHQTLVGWVAAAERLLASEPKDFRVFRQPLKAMPTKAFNAQT
jgi:hypothetical protein